MSTPRIRIGIQIQPQHADYSQIRDIVAEADESGVDIIYTWDHFFPLGGDPDGRNFECWTMLAAWAEATSNAELGALVTCNSYRNPDLLADMARTVDHISDGRLILGIGAGWFQRDYDEYGYEFGTPGTRLNDLGNALPRVKARWSALSPKPTRDIPVLIGGSGEQKTLHYVAEHGDMWHAFGNAATLTHKGAVLDSWCDKIGRDPAEIERSTSVSRPPSGSEGALREAGITLFTMSTSGPAYDLSLVREWVSWRDAMNA